MDERAMSEYVYCSHGEPLANDSGEIALARKEIVRCRDCIYYMRDPEPIDPGWPMMCDRTGDDMIEPFGFCACAERKEVAR